ncbi:hypothetical protein RHGRI_024792 [Rhododendron griersonianum]|uniref:Uncharacterized protein n=1 Tax=Rhododendron griersonianum TaxID=479676 RepID=A0AAV6IYH4_9ERIC|nr:hypothetical protein RHGRI_026823 [Rhododendron griersonianum]KAG5537475.1 hypothetical protein RHGRI_024792 [Rhododendron griersonianum]
MRRSSCDGHKYYFSDATNRDLEQQTRHLHHNAVKMGCSSWMALMLIHVGREHGEVVDPKVGGVLPDAGGGDGECVGPGEGGVVGSFVQGRRRAKAWRRESEGCEANARGERERQREREGFFGEKNRPNRYPCILDWAWTWWSFDAFFWTGR